MIDLDAIALDDLKPGAQNPGPMTVERAFTLCELIAYRIRDGAAHPMERATAASIAAAIDRIAQAWR